MSASDAVYTGDASSYAVTIDRRQPSKGTIRVRIDAVLSGEGTIPLGAVVTVPARRVVEPRK